MCTCRRFSRLGLNWRRNSMTAMSGSRPMAGASSSEDSQNTALQRGSSRRQAHQNHFQQGVQTA